MKYIIGLFLMLFTQASAANVTYLEQGAKAPYSGYLFTPEKEKEVRVKIQLYDTQEDLLNILQKRLDNQLDQNVVLSDRLEKRETTEFYKNLIYFALGVYVTTVAVDLAK